jgi:hypothetical protein
MQERHVASERREHARADGLPQAQHDFHDVAHREPLDRRALRARQRRRESDGAARGRPRLQHAERQREQRGASAQPQHGTAERAVRDDLDAARRPSDLGHDRGEAQRVRTAHQRRREEVRQAVVAVERSQRGVAALGAARLRLLEQAARRHAGRVGRVEPLDEADHHLARRRRQTPRELGTPQDVHHRDVLVRQVFDHGLDRSPSLLGRGRIAMARALVALRMTAEPRMGFAESVDQVRRPAVDELGTGLDGCGPARRPLRVDAAADSRPRLEHDHA